MTAEVLYSGRPNRSTIRSVRPDLILRVFPEATVPRTFRNCKQDSCVSNALPVFLTEHLPSFIRGHVIHKVWERCFFLFQLENEATLVFPSTHSTSMHEVTPLCTAASGTRTQDTQELVPAAGSLGAYSSQTVILR